MVHFWVSPPSSRVMYFFAGFKKSHPILDQTQGFGAVFPDFTEHSIEWKTNDSPKRVLSQICVIRTWNSIPSPCLTLQRREGAKFANIGNNPPLLLLKTLENKTLEETYFKNWVLVFNKKMFWWHHSMIKSCSILHCINASLLSLLSFLSTCLSPDVIPNKI
jgi:hypothetical protein